MLKSNSMIIALLIFWIILSTQTTPFFIIAALVSVLSIAFIDKKIFPPISLSFKWRYLLLAWQLFKDMLLSSLIMMRIIFLNKKINSKLEWIKAPKDHQVAYANAITLTPGTMAMDLRDNKILVHSIEEVSK